jgi:hypothetical protein
MNEQKEENTRADNDGGWKQIINAHLKDFVEFFWPDAYEDIDWEKPYEFLEQELLSIGIPEAIGKHYIDKLFKVFLKSGKEQWILLHIEIQNEKDGEFSKRMFTYFYRIFDTYDKAIASLAILADTNKTWRPNRFHQKIWQSEISRTYEVVKLIDYKSRTAELGNHPNPFAMVVLVQLAAMETQPDDQQRLLTKLEFFRSLCNRGWPLEKCMSMYKFLDAILGLNRNFEVEYIKRVKRIEEEYNMTFTLTAERHGYENGIQKGVHLGEAGLLMRLLEVKFNTLPETYVEKIKNADPNTLNRWGINFVKAESLDDIFVA